MMINNMMILISAAGSEATLHKYLLSKYDKTVR